MDKLGDQIYWLFLVILTNYHCICHFMPVCLFWSWLLWPFFGYFGYFFDILGYFCYFCYFGYFGWDCQTVKLEQAR